MPEIFTNYKAEKSQVHLNYGTLNTAFMCQHFKSKAIYDQILLSSNICAGTKQPKLHHQSIWKVV